MATVAVTMAIDIQVDKAVEMTMAIEAVTETGDSGVRVLTNSDRRVTTEKRRRWGRERA